MRDKKVLVLAGGTLGHINPALVISQMLYNLDYKVIFVCTKNYENSKKIIENKYITESIFLDCPGLSRKRVLLNFKRLFVLLKTFSRIKHIIKGFGDDIILSIGMGGSISTIGLYCSTKNNIKTIAHEQNAVIGLGNKFIMKKVDKFLTSFPSSYGVFVGNPVESVCHEDVSNREGETILIFGGSIGSDTINDFFIDNKDLFKREVFLFTGSRYYKENVDKIELNNTNKFHIFESTNNMNNYYKKANVVICRGGSSTLFEVIGYKLPSIIIPSPNVSNNHQFENASYFENKGAMIIIDENSLSVDRVIRELEYIHCHYREIVRNIEKCSNPFSKYKLIDEVMEVIYEKNNESY